MHGKYINSFFMNPQKTLEIRASRLEYPLKLVSSNIKNIRPSEDRSKILLVSQSAFICTLVR